MYQAFILYCMLGADASIETCWIEYSNFAMEYQQDCEAVLIARVEEILPIIEADGYYIYDVGCHEYLLDNVYEGNEL